MRIFEARLNIQQNHVSATEAHRCTWGSRKCKREGAEPPLNALIEMLNTRSNRNDLDLNRNIVSH